LLFRINLLKMDMGRATVQFALPEATLL